MQLIKENNQLIDQLSLLNGQKYILKIKQIGHCVQVQWNVVICKFDILYLLNQRINKQLELELELNNDSNNKDINNDKKQWNLFLYQFTFGNRFFRFVYLCLILAGCVCSLFLFAYFYVLRCLCFFCFLFCFLFFIFFVVCLFVTRCLVSMFVCVIITRLWSHVTH